MEAHRIGVHSTIKMISANMEQLIITCIRCTHCYKIPRDGADDVLTLV